MSEFFDMNELLTKALSVVSPDGITILVLVVCIILLIPCLNKKAREITPTLSEIAPTLMVSAGIIGTFWGTFIALAAFETGAGAEEMINSIPVVLGGMKSAFITSLIGLLFAFCSRAYMKLFVPEAEPKPNQIEKDFSDLLREIKKGISDEGETSLSTQIGKLQAQYRDSTSELKQAIAGDGDSSIATQLTKLRNENSDGFRAMNEQFAKLSETIGDSLGEKMQALIDEIRESIREGIAKQLEQTNALLREQLTEMLERIEEALIKQFGETFKQFNEATQAIKKWQEDHRQHVEQLTAAFELTAKGIEQIRTNCDSIPATMQTLQDLLGELDERLKAFAEMKTAAEQSFPIIKDHLDKIGADLQKSAEGFDGLEQTITSAYTKASELAQQHIEESRQHIENVGNQINLTAEKVSTAAQSMMDSFNQQATATIEQTAKKTEDMLAESRNASVKHQEDIRNVVNMVTTQSEECVQETQKILQQMAEDHAKKINDVMAGIAQRWGANMISIAVEAAKRIQDAKQIEAATAHNREGQ